MQKTVLMSFGRRKETNLYSVSKLYQKNAFFVSLPEYNRKIISSMSHANLSRKADLVPAIFVVTFNFLLFSLCQNLQHKNTKEENKKLKACAKEYEDMLMEYKNQVDRQQTDGQTDRHT